MESKDNQNDSVFKTRLALTDVSNLPSKRPFSSISGTGYDSDSQLQKQLCLREQDLVNKSCQLRFGAVGTHHKEEGKSPCVNNVWDESNLLSENPVGFGEKNQGRIDCDFSVGNQGIESNEREFSVVGKLPVAGELPMPTISASHDRKFVGLERCTGLKGVAGANSSLGSEDILKKCTCSFCSKAAYIWSDLYYQDVNGRLATLRKSQKEANLLVHKFSGGNETVTSGQQNTSESSKLELSLMDQWKSLFVHMEKTFAQESSQLESSCDTLKILRDSCKADLGSTGNSHSDNH
ncbi:hypothetical protein TanjilG_05767 [Lupinus angustifolius]|uniref:Uncharacterized protein n=1 Tax=Lupinus angustifolius TaxID=3871 RepID=A0A4P1R3L1_LUPAN|nr:PREDICTED: uncharacterized protein LOC109362446 [Lupinus angustifolius]OIW00417.1 hypothetical protein TanjilG_05767 [Lupinus angustifolius]